MPAASGWIRARLAVARASGPWLGGPRRDPRNEPGSPKKRKLGIADSVS